MKHMLHIFATYSCWFCCGHFQCFFTNI